MSQCMTIADETIDQKDTSAEITPKEVVEFILEETLLSVFIISDKDCRLIGDFNITDDCNQQYERLSYLRDFEQVEHSQNQSGLNQESNQNSGENIDRLGSLATAKENLEIIIDTFVRKEEKIKPANDCTIISEEILADNELQITNGQIHLEKNKTDKLISDPEKQEYCDKRDVIKSDKIEIEYYNEGKLSKIYVPLNPNIDYSIEQVQREEKSEDASEEKEVKNITDITDKISSEENLKRPFEPFTTEELRQSTLQIWENGNSSLVGKWSGDVLAQKEEVVRLMEELSSVQMFPESISDPNRPRACAFAEEDVKKMTKEIEEISFTQSRANSDDSDVTWLPDGQGDADLESKSFTRSKDSIEKLPEEFYINSISASKSNIEKKSDRTQDQELETLQSQSKELFQNSYCVTPNILECLPTSTTPGESTENIKLNASSLLKSTEDHVSEDHSLHTEITEDEECLLKSSIYNESTTKINASLDRVSNSNCSEDRLSEKIYEVKENLFCASYLASKEDIQKANEILQTDSIDLKEFQNGHDLCEEFFPESVSLSGNIGSLRGSKQDEFTLKNLELSSELDLKSFQEKSDTPKESQSFNSAPEFTYSTQKNMVSLERLSCITSETYNILNGDSFSEGKNLTVPSTDPGLISEKIEKKTEGNDCDSLVQEPNLEFDKIPLEVLQSDENSNLITEKINESLEKTVVYNEKNLANLKEKVCTEENRLFEAQMSKSQISINGSDSTLNQNKLSAHESNKSLNDAEEMYNTETNKESSVSSQTMSEKEDSKESLNESKFLESSEASDINAPKFKLHSQKMYFGADYNPAGQALNEFSLLESEETFIDLTENVIQVIEPPETVTDEDNCGKISFSLLFEKPNQKTPPCYESGSQVPFEKNSPGESEIYPKKVYSGMTTVGPFKNLDYDPKILTAPEIDYGKMTRITSSRQLAKDMSLFSSEVNTGISVKIIEEDDSDDDETSLNVEEDHLNRGSLLNRDIASLTKVQKVREVMSYLPKSEEDFEDEDALPRPRLDLKDVESMTDERYKVPDVSIPLLSFELDETNIDAGKELIESMGLVISGLTNPAYYEEEIEEINPEIQKIQSNLDKDCDKVRELSNKNLISKKSSKTLIEDTEEGKTSMLRLEKENKSKVEFAEELTEKSEQSEQNESLSIDNNNSQNERDSGHTKYSTLGSVFKKASSKILRKDVDFLMRNSKSLPRDTSKICTTDSIRSILDDCQSSASNMLKKSRSLLKNTQSILRSISQNRMSSDRNLEQNPGTNKLSPSESDVTTLGKKFPSCLKPEYFTKTKISLKTKAEKTIQNFDITSSTSSEPEITPEEKNLRISDRNEENLQTDRTENFKKVLPKSPLIYKSQFVKSQMSFHVGTEPEPVEADVEFVVADDQLNIVQNIEMFPNTSQPEGSTEKTVDEARELPVPTDPKEINIQEKLQWVTSVDNLDSLTNNESEPRQLDYIVMETIQGLPQVDLESPSSEKENLNVENNGDIKLEKENDIKRMEESNSLQIFADGNRDVAPCFPEVDEEKIVTKTPSEKKIKAKKKKFTARFRSFWCSAFGRVKTQPKKGDLS